MWNMRPQLGLLVCADGVQAYELPGGRELGRFAQLEAALASLPGHAAVSVVVSDAYCRYALLARPPGLRSVAELELAAQSRLRAIYGGLEAWPTRIHAAPGGDLDLIVALDPTLQQSVQQALAATGRRLHSLRGHWLAWAQRWWPSLARGAHWLVVHDGEWVGVGFVQQGRCLQVRTLRSCSAGSLDQLLAREQAFCDADSQARVWIGGQAMGGPSQAAAAPSDGAMRIWSPNELWSA